MNLKSRIDNLKKKFLSMFDDDNNIDWEKWNQPHKDDIVFQGFEDIDKAESNKNEKTIHVKSDEQIQED